jgi:hypothetical protein
MGGWDDGAAVQGKAQLRLLSALSTLRLQDSTERTDASGIAHHPVPEVRRRIRRDGGPKTHQHILSAAFARRHTLGPMRSKRALPKQAASFIETMDCLPVSKLPDGALLGAPRQPRPDGSPANERERHNGPRGLIPRPHSRRAKSPRYGVKTIEVSPGGGTPQLIAVVR